VLEIISRAKLTIPTVLFSYLNPLIEGRRRAAARRRAGADGVLVTDLPLGADPERESWFANSPLDFIRLAPRRRRRRASARSRARGAGSSI
jgi:Tryptophan synthase alpha chain